MLRSIPVPQATQLALAMFILVTVASSGLAAPPTVGYRDFNFGPNVNSTPTGEKPESKVWWNDASWWGSLWDPALNLHAIHRLDAGTQTWVSTGTAIDPRTSSRADALWDGSRLYVVSHVFTTNPDSTNPANSGRLYRYSYNAASRTYSLDTGFPVNVNSSRSETLVLAKDSNGRLWVTWVEAGKVKVNRTLGDDLTWGQPFDLPVQGSDVAPDDISSVAALGDRVGVLWSNQIDRKLYFAVHRDAVPDNNWLARETALADTGAVADDHLNLKVSCDGAGALYAVVKTALSGPTDPVVYVLRRQASGTWSRHVFGTQADDHTRPILLIEQGTAMAHVVAQSNRSGRQVLYMKSAALSDLQFATGLGTPLIDSPDDSLVNNPTSTKQCVSAASGLVVLASDQSSRNYLHNHVPLGSGIAAVIAGFFPAQGPAGTEVTITGSRLSGATRVRFNGTTASHVVQSDFQLRAVVPSGATTGTIRVTAPGGDVYSSSSFVVIRTPTISSFTPSSGPIGTIVTINGSRFTGTSSVSFGGVPATDFTVSSDTRIEATVPEGAVTGKIRVTNAAGSIESATNFTLPVITTLAFRPEHDAQVKSTSPTTNYGQLATLRVRAPDPGYQSYLKFVIGGINGQIQRATLRLYANSASDSGGAVHAASPTYRGTTSPWMEDSLVWDNAPPVESPALDSLGAVALDTWAEFDVTAAVTGNGVESFVCRSGSTSSAIFSSDEGAHPPQLVLLVANQSTTDVGDPTPATRTGLSMLHKNRPNPFRSATDLSFELVAATRVRLAIHDVRGRRMRELVDERLPTGLHHARWDGRDGEGRLLPSGIYFVRLETPASVLGHKLLLIR